MATKEEKEKEKEQEKGLSIGTHSLPEFVHPMVEEHKLKHAKTADEGTSSTTTQHSHSETHSMSNLHSALEHDEQKDTSILKQASSKLKSLRRQFSRQNSDSSNNNALAIPEIRIREDNTESTPPTALLQPPPWLSSKGITECFACHDKFSLTLRKHHCRSCGAVFCYKCTSNKTVLPAYGFDTPVRVCNNCFFAKRSSLTASSTLLHLQTMLEASSLSDSTNSMTFVGSVSEDELSDFVDLGKHKGINLKESGIIIENEDSLGKLEDQLNAPPAAEPQEEEEKVKKEAKIEEQKPTPNVLEESINLTHSFVFMKNRTNIEVPKLRIVILIVGSRGDVQPFIALGKELTAQGHFVRIATHEVFRSFVGSHGLDFYPIAGDPKELMALMVENNMFSYQFVKQGVVNHRRWVKALLNTCWEACITAPTGEAIIDDEQDLTLDEGNESLKEIAKEQSQLAEWRADFLICNPPSMAGPHIAERLGIPLHMAFTMPWSPTKAYCSPFVTSSTNSSPLINYTSYGLVDQLIWVGTRDLVNSWRKKILKISPIVTGSVQEGSIIHRRKIPFIYCYTEHLLPKPSDWGSHIDISGFWFLDASDAAWKPPEVLEKFFQAGDPPVFIGFGSIVVKDPDALTHIIVEAATNCGKRVIIQQGWAGMKPQNLPDSIILIEAAPHDWLFPRCCAVVHHGGAGTTAAGLRAGKPTVIVPFFGDQFFWGRCISQMGYGPPAIPYSSLTSSELAKAICEATGEEMMKKAAEIAKLIGAENGVQKACTQLFEKLPLGAMTCDVKCSNLAMFFCYDCGMKMCKNCDAVVHKLSLVADHKRHFHQYMDWSSRDQMLGELSQAMITGAWGLTSGLFTGLGTIAASVKEEGLMKGFGKGLKAVASDAASVTNEFWDHALHGVTDAFTGYDKLRAKEGLYHLTQTPNAQSNAPSNDEDLKTLNEHREREIIQNYLGVAKEVLAEKKAMKLKKDQAHQQGHHLLPIRKK